MTKDRITSRANPLVKRLRALAADRKARESEGLYLCEGEVMLGEALASEAAICDVLYAARTAQPLLDAAAARGAVLTAAADDIVSHCASVVSAQSVVFTVRIPAAKPCGSVERLLLLDGVADPGNAGTILRIADAFSFDAVWLTGACVDPYAPKVVRSAMGARFRIPTVSPRGQTLLQRCARTVCPCSARRFRLTAFRWTASICRAGASFWATKRTASARSCSHSATGAFTSP